MFRSMTSRVAVLSCLLALSLSTPDAARGQDINTIAPPQSGLGQLSQSFWWGQTFTVPSTASFLSSVGLEWGWQIDPSLGVGGMFTLTRWSGTGTVGPTLFSSAFTTDSIEGPLWTLTSFQTNLTVTPGDVYVALLEASGRGFATLPFYADNYSGGSAVSLSVPLNRWTVNSDQEMGFQATFGSGNGGGGGQVVPEPASVLMLATGLFGLGGIGLNRRREKLA